MKKYLIVILFVITQTLCFAQNSEIDVVKQVVTSAYIEGIQNGGEIEEIKKGFHPSFNMLRLMENEIRPLPIQEWIANIEKSRKENSTKPKVRTEGKFISTDITGTTAIVKLELYREGKIIFTDYLTLFKFNEGWKIVSKSFYRHP